MNTEKINYLLQEIYNKKYEHFDILFNYCEKKLKDLSNEIYKYIIDKCLYDTEDIIQEIWLQLLLQLTSEKIQVLNLNDFDNYLKDTADIVLIKINE